jgi:hypothetical protein
MAWAKSVGLDHPAHLCHLIRTYTVRLFVRNNPRNQIAISVDPDQTARMCRLIWTCNVRPGVKWNKRLKTHFTVSQLNF